MVIEDSSLKEVLINPKSNRNEYQCDCPFDDCGKQQHFYINKVTQLWHCKKCDRTGNIFFLLKELDKLYLITGRIVKANEIQSITSFTLEKQELDLTTPEIKMPVGFKRVWDNEYLENKRGFIDEDFFWYEVGHTSVKKKYSDYVLFPVYENSKKVGFVGRYSGKGDKIRYLNSDDTDFSKLLYGIDEIVVGVTKKVILVEGIFDKRKVDKILKLYDFNEIKCLCTFGKKISEFQIAKLKLRGIENVLLLFDYDAIKQIKRIGVVLKKTFNTTITYTSSKDIDECTDDEAIDVLLNEQSVFSFNRNVIAKLK